MEFKFFQRAVQEKFKSLSASKLILSLSIDKDEIYKYYLESFPENSNPIFRERTQHDCNCCRSFITTVGCTVAISCHPYELDTIWNCSCPDEPNYQIVANKMHRYVMSKAKQLLISPNGVNGVFSHHSKHCGEDVSYDPPFTFNHFYIALDPEFVTNDDTLSSNADYIQTVQLFTRGLHTISDNALEIVLDLINQGSLYRGDQYKSSVVKFAQLKEEYNSLENYIQKAIFLWSMADTKSSSVLRIRNSSIGTLLVDISEGRSLDSAVSSYEDKVAPHNYKRRIPIVTESMKNKARDEITKAGFMPSLSRKVASLDDIPPSVFMFRDTTPVSMSESSQDDVFANIKPTSNKVSKNISKIDLDTFINQVIPSVSTIELLVGNTFSKNLMTLVTEKHKGSELLFPWDNPVSWSYSGLLASSSTIKERVKSAGGVVDAEFRSSLSWYNTDDLDIRMKEPDGNIICFHNKGVSRLGGRLDVDMNVNASTATSDAVENIYYKTTSGMKPGIYTLSVHNYTLRNRADYGFEVETDFKGDQYLFSYPNLVKQNEEIVVAKFRLHESGELTIESSIDFSSSEKSISNVKSGSFVKVSAILSSPNYWGENEFGTKHLFLISDELKFEEAAAPFYNEFLRGLFSPYSRAMELLTQELAITSNPNQAVGFGFNLTEHGSFIVKVKGSFTRTLEVSF